MSWTETSMLPSSARSKRAASLAATGAGMVEHLAGVLGHAQRLIQRLAIQFDHRCPLLAAWQWQGE